MCGNMEPVLLLLLWLPGENFYNFVKMFPSDAGGGEGGVGGAPLVRGAGDGDTDVTHWTWGPARLWGVLLNSTT